MREALNDIAICGRIVIGEGEIDHAPMLWIGEEVGRGIGPAVDIAVDPIEGTRMVAMGQSNALAVMAFAPQGSLFHAPDMYMKKLVVNAAAAGQSTLHCRWRRTSATLRGRWASRLNVYGWSHWINHACTLLSPRRHSWASKFLLCPMVMSRPAY